ncbi:DUF1439 domain-containing protein [Catenovulum sp. 2E275]|uniref:DUF1439 domain-containing protein n=1 Tax=Catenovulum sp. 2E275 TaxID=2980497 RepID=UPI0021D08A72|nr:DUF1439 domain-containing protein [Catenovulum sp. 2E275]MCU4676999.1 DUF1439 domain-containing protein [Catenovulum sp. 2E275]
MRKYLTGLTLLLISVKALAFSYTLEIPQAQLQTKVDEMMPLERGNFLVTLTLSRPIVDLSAGDDLIAIDCQIDALALGSLTGTGTTRIIGNLTYDPESAAFFFKNPKVEKLTIKNLPDAYLPDVKDITQMAVANILATYPVYKLDETKQDEKLAMSFLQSVQVKNKKLIVTLGLNNKAADKIVSSNN